MSESIDQNNYGEDQIDILEGLEAVRVMPEMYIGSREKRGLHHLIWEIIDNSVDEYMAGFCDRISVTIHNDNSITVEDNGRGIPVGTHKKQNKPTVEVVLTVLHAGGKFGGEGPYKSSGGLHGVGSACVNALSEHMIATVKRSGKIYQMEFKKGIPSKELQVVGETDENDTGTSIWFKPDPTIFVQTTEYDYQEIYNHLRESSFLNGGLNISLTDERVQDENNKDYAVSFYYENGIKDFVSHLNRNKTPASDHIFHFTETIDDIYVEAAFQYTLSYDEYTASFANNIKTVEGGTHETGFKSALTQVIKQITEQKQMFNSGDEPLTGEDVRTGLVAIVSIKIGEPQFEGQTKNKLSNTEVRAAVQKVIQEKFLKVLSDNPKILKPILDKVMESYRERINLKRARQEIRKKNKREDSSFTLPEKLSDCRQKTPVENREIFIVEGDSAGGSAKSARHSEFQAILPLRGKILNVEKSSLKKVFSNQEIDNIASAVGTGIGEDFKYDQLRYNKIVIMTDADVDGAHIQILLLTFFYRYMRPLLENGHIFLAQPPLYGLKKNNKILKFINDENELEQAKKDNPKASVQRYKGLGEMNPKELKDTTMDPDSRQLVRVAAQDIQLVSELFESLMGDSSADRKRFIEENSHKADIDI